MRGGRIRGWRRFEWLFRGIAGDAVDPVWNTSHFSKGVPTSRCVANGAPIRRPRDLSHAYWRLISMVVKFDLNRRWSAPRPSTGRQPCMKCNILYIILTRSPGNYYTAIRVPPAPSAQAADIAGVASHP